MKSDHLRIKKSAADRAAFFISSLFSVETDKKVETEIQRWFIDNVGSDDVWGNIEKEFDKLAPNNAPDKLEIKKLRQTEKIIGFDKKRPQAKKIAEPTKNPAKKELKPKNIAHTPKFSYKPVIKKPLFEIDTRQLITYTTRIAAVLIPVAVIIGGAWMLFHTPRVEPEVQHLAANVAIETPVEGQRRIVLPDQSQVWLQPETKIKYNDDFSADRYVEIEGEAFFNITKNAELPFRVKAGEMVVEVLGTEFSVKTAHKGGKASVTLATGSVKVKTADNKEIELTPNQRLTIDPLSSDPVVIEEALVEELEAVLAIVVSLDFIDKPLESALRDVAAYYGLSFSAPQWKPTRDLINLDLTNQLHPAQVLDIIQNITDAFEYEIANDELIIKPSR